MAVIKKAGRILLMVTCNIAHRVEQKPHKL